MPLPGTSQFILFCLILMRMSGFVLLNPVLGRKNIPALFRGGMALVLALTILPTAGEPEINADLPWQLGLMLLQEFAVGALLGFSMSLFEMVLTYAGAIMDFQMGLSMSTVYDSQNGVQIAMTGQILQIIYMLLFFAVDGHLALMKILLTSGEAVPYGSFVFNSIQADAVVALFTECAVLAVKLAFPVIMIEFLTEVAVGMISKIIPQINLFVLNIEVKVAVGILALFALNTPVREFIKELISQMIRQLQEILRIAGA